MVDLSGLMGKLVFISEGDGECICQEVLSDEDLENDRVVNLNLPSPGDRDGLCSTVPCKILSVRHGQTPIVQIKRIAGGQL